MEYTRKVDDMVRRCARIIHEVNNDFRVSIGEEPKPVSAECINTLATAVKAQWFKPVGPRESHERWLAAKEAAGWEYGEVEDEQAKAHPCILSYDALPERQRIKDILFTSIVGAFFPHAKVEPEPLTPACIAVSGEPPADQDEANREAAIEDDIERENNERESPPETE